MIAKLKKITLQAIAGANCATILLMLLVGYSGHINPTYHPMLSNVGLLFPAFIVINAAFLLFWVIVKLKGAVIPFVGYILCYGPMRTYIPFNLPVDPPVGAIKVLSFNTEGYHNMRSDVATFSDDTIASYILHSGADIVCVQEGTHVLDFDSTFRKRYPYIKEEKRGMAAILWPSIADTLYAARRLSIFCRQATSAQLSTSMSTVKMCW